MSSSSGYRVSARPLLCLTVLIAIFAVRLLDGAVSHSLTADEPHYMGTGVYLWKTGDYHFAKALFFQPPLAYHLASLPLLALDLSAVGNDRDVSKRLLESGAIDRTAYRVVSRLPFIALACWGLVLVFCFAREAAGAAAGLLAAFVYSFSPMLLAYGFLVHSDVLIGVLYAQVIYTYWRWQKKPSAGRLLLCGVSLGLALLAKYSALLLLPTLGLMLLDELRRRPPAARARWFLGICATLAATTLAVLWLGYGGSFASVAEPGSRFPEIALPGWLQPFFFYLDIHEAGRRVYFLGEFASEWSGFLFFPLAYAIKTPVGNLALLVLALLSLRHTPSPLGRFMGVPVAVFLAFLFFWLNVPMGLRYMLPLYPLIAVFIGTQLATIGPGWTRRVAAVAMLWTAFAGFWIHPHYLAYFNELVGGPKSGHHYLLDANLDWGQDLVALAESLRERGNPIVSLAYFGPEKPSSYGIRSRPLLGCKPVSGVVAVSANVREELYAFPNLFAKPTPGCYDWLRDHEPVARPGYSIFLYDLSPHATR